MLFLSIAQIYSSGFSDDLAHYHGGQILNSDNSKYISWNKLFAPSLWVWITMATTSLLFKFK